MKKSNVIYYKNSEDVPINYRIRTSTDDKFIIQRQRIYSKNKLLWPLVSGYKWYLSDEWFDTVYDEYPTLESATESLKKLYRNDNFVPTYHYVEVDL